MTTSLIASSTRTAASLRKTPRRSGWDIRWDAGRATRCVVDSVGFNDKTWTSRYGVSHTEKLRTTERYRRTDFGHIQVEMTYTDPGAYAKPWGFTENMTLAADTEMLESICEWSSDNWTVTDSEKVTVPPDVLASYVGTYSGIYGGNKRTIDVTLSGGQLMVKIVGAADIEGGLGTAGLNPDAPQVWCRDRRRGLKPSDSVSSSWSTTRVSRRTSSRFTYPARTNSRASGDRSGRFAMRLFLAALVLIVGTIPAEAQWLDRKTPGIPRTPDGKPNLAAPAPRGPDGKPDLTGVWNGPNPEPHIDPANAQPWVKDLLRQREQNYWKERPLYRCLPSGPEAEKFSGWKRIVQTPTAMAILNDDLTYRVIHTDGRQLETNPAPQWMGYSVGRWDGDTLIVDSVGFNDQTWLSHYGHAHTEALRVREGYRRRNFGHLQVEVTFTDPAAYIKPWGFTFNLTLAADTEMLESVCEVSSDHWTGTISDAA